MQGKIQEYKLYCGLGRGGGRGKVKQYLLNLEWMNYRCKLLFYMLLVFYVKLIIITNIPGFISIDNPILLPYSRPWPRLNSWSCYFHISNLQIVGVTLNWIFFWLVFSWGNKQIGIRNCWTKEQSNSEPSREGSWQGSRIKLLHLWQTWILY